MSEDNEEFEVDLPAYEDFLSFADRLRDTPEYQQFKAESEELEASGASEAELNLHAAMAAVAQCDTVWKLDLFTLAGENIVITWITDHLQRLLQLVGPERSIELLLSLASDIENSANGTDPIHAIDESIKMWNQLTYARELRRIELEAEVS